MLVWMAGCAELILCAYMWGNIIISEGQTCFRVSAICMNPVDPVSLAPSYCSPWSTGLNLSVGNLCASLEQTGQEAVYVD